MPYISVIPSSKLVMVDSEPLVLESLDFPDEVHSLYYDTDTKIGKLQLTDPTKLLQSIEYVDIETYYEAFKKEKKAMSKKQRTTKSKSADTNSSVDDTRTEGEV